MELLLIRQGPSSALGVSWGRFGEDLPKQVAHERTSEYAMPHRRRPARPTFSNAAQSFNT